MLKRAGWGEAGEGRPLYLVGGSWRALARLDMHIANYSLPILHQYAMTADAVTRLGQPIPRLEKSWLRDVPELSNARIATLGDSAALLSTLLRCLGCEKMVVSAFVIRVGLRSGQHHP